MRLMRVLQFGKPRTGGTSAQVLQGPFVWRVTYSFSAADRAYLIKTNSLGDTLWTRTFGGSGEYQGNSVPQTSDSGYIITGGTSWPGYGGDVYLIKTNSLGDAIWTQKY